MTMLEFPELKETEGTLNERRKKLYTIFDEAGPTFDMGLVKSLDGDSQAKVDAIRTINEEIDDLAKKAEGLRVVAAGAENAQDYDDGTGTLVETGDDSPRGGRGGKSIGDQFALALKDAPDVKKFKAELDKVDMKTLLSTAAGWAPDIIRGPRLVEFATRPPSILDFIPTTTTNQTSVAYMEETTFTNAAVEVGEGLVKPEAALAFTERTSIVRKIAVFLPVTDEQVEDVPRIKAYLDNRLGFMVRQRLSGQVLTGLGTGILLRGFLNVVGIQTQAKGADPTPDSVYKAMVLVMTTGQAQPDAFVVNPLDWQDIRLLRTVDGIYIWGSPSEAGPERIWGLPAVLEQGITAGTGLVGAFQVYSELAMKKGLTVETGYNGTDWTFNLQTIRAELRAALVVYRPTAFCSVTGI